MTRALWLASTATFMLGLAAPAWAQEAPDADESGAESGDDSGVILVTARRRVENLIDVPLSITAVTEEEIQASGIENVSDLSRQVPGFSFKQGFGRTGSGDGGASVRPSIRGMSNILGTPNAGFFVDGIFVSQNITSYQLDSLERVEVIRGPQSALFGRQTFSGAINFVTRKPGNDLRGAVNATLGQFGHGEVSGYIQIPLIQDRLAMELNARVYHFGGDYVNQDSGKRDINAQDTRNFGARIRINPTDNLEIMIGGSASHDVDKGYSSFIVAPAQLNCFLPTIIGTISGIPRSSTRTRGYYCGEIKTPGTFAYNNAEIEALGYHPLERTSVRSDVAVTYTTDNDWEFKVVGAFNWQENQNGFDNTYLPSTNPSITIEYRSNRDKSFQGHISSPGDKPVRGQFGVYYFAADDDQQYSLNTTTTSPNYRLRSGSFSADAIRNKAVFGQIEAELGKLTVSAEARYQEDKIIGSSEVNVLLGRGTPINIRSTKYKSFLPRVTARYELTSDWNLYGSVAKGNKPGGFNDYPADANAASVADFNSRALDTFDEESVWSYELGTKGRIGRLNFNIAGYHLDWSAQQLTLSYPYQRTPQNDFRTAPFIVNAGKSRVNGVEFELFGNVTDFFDIRIAYAYNDAKFIDFYDENTETIFDTDGRPSFLDPNQTRVNPADVDGPDGQVRGNRLPQTPVHQLALNGNLKFPISDKADFFIRSDLTYDSKRYVQVDNLAHTGDSVNVNLRTGVDLGNGLTLTAFVNNLTDDRSPVVGTRLFDFNRSLLIPDPVRITFGQPLLLSFYRNFLVSAPRRRQFGLSASFRF